MATRIGDNRAFLRNVRELDVLLAVETIYFERKKLRREKLKLIQLYLATYEERILE